MTLQELLVAISLGLFIAYCISAVDVQSVTEGFDTTSLLSELPTPPTPFLSDTTDDPRDLPWIASWSPADRAARQGHNCTVEYTEDGPDGTTVITTSKSCEDGLPHTRTGGRIMLPDSLPVPLRAEVIAHEMIHIYQARDPDAWAAFYKRSWGFDIGTTPPAGIPSSVTDARRSNPDTWRAPWCCWKERWWPVAIYTDPVHPTLRQARTVWWDDYRRTLLLEAPDEWTAFFGDVSQPEHPHEIAAVLLVRQDRQSEAGRRLQNWWLSHGTLLRLRAA